MAGEGVISEQTCERCLNNIKQQFSTGERRMNAHGEDITDLKILMGSVVKIQEIQTETLKRLEEKRDSTSFWQSKSGTWIIVGAVIAVLMLVMAGIGQNYLQDFIPLVKSVK